MKSTRKKTPPIFFNPFTVLLAGVFVALGLVMGSGIIGKGLSGGNVLSESSEVKNETTKEKTESKDEDHDREQKEDKEQEEEVENENETENEKEVEVKNGNEEVKVKISRSKNKFSIKQPGFKFQVESSFPLSVDPATRELAVTTPAGIKTVAVLPQQAVNNMLAKGFITQVLGGTIPTQSPSATAVGITTSASSGVTFATTQNGTLVYQVEGLKNKKLFGVFAISIPKTLNVSAQNGDLININQSTFSKILDTFSI